MPGEPSSTDGSDEEGASARVHDRGELHVHMNGAIPVPTILEIMNDDPT